MWSSWRGMWRSVSLRNDPWTVESFIHRVSDLVLISLKRFACTCEICFTMVRRSHLLSPLISFSHCVLSQRFLAGAANVFWQLMIQHRSVWRPVRQPPASHPKTSSLLTLLYVASWGQELSGFISRAPGHSDRSQQG